MPDADKINEFLEKLKPCIDKGELDACVDEAVRLAEEMGISASDLLELSNQAVMDEVSGLAYVLADAAAEGLEGKEKAMAHSNAGFAAQNLENIGIAEEQYKLAIEANPTNADSHYYYACLLHELKRQDEAEEQYNLSIEYDPKDVDSHYNYAILLHELKKLDEAEEQYKLVIEADPKYAVAHNNYAILLKGLKRLDEAEKQYKLAIKADQKHAAAHSNYANLLQELKKLDEAEKQYKLAIEIDWKLAAAHGNYGLLLIEKDNRKEAWDKIQKASVLFAESKDFTKSHLAKAWFYERCSEKYFKHRKFHESGDDVGKAGDEYLKASESADADLKDNFLQQGNILKAKSFVRKVPKKSWRSKIPIIGKKSDITDIINNLKQAAYYYERAAQCPIEEKQDVCNACHTSISVFSETLSAMDALLNKRNAEINKKEWDKSLESARLIYNGKKMKNGVALVDTLKQLIKCVDEIAAHKENGLEIQKNKCGKCFGRLAEVSEKLDGALSVLAEHSMEAIADYAKKQGMGGFLSEETNKSVWNNWLVKGVIVAVATIFLNLVSDKLINLNILATIWNYLKSLIP